MNRNRAALLALPVFIVLAIAALSAQAELVKSGSLHISVSAGIQPHLLPRSGRAPIAVSIVSRLTTSEGEVPPPIKRLRIELNRHGRLQTLGLPECDVTRIYPASTKAALRACRPALVGRGSFSVDVVLGGQKPYPTSGRLLLFNGRSNGRPAVLAQIYSARPFANSFVVPFAIARPTRGLYGTVMTAIFPPAFTSWGHITDLRLHLTRRYRYRSAHRSFISAGCPLPTGVSMASFRLARTSFTFADDKIVAQTLRSSCKAR